MDRKSEKEMTINELLEERKRTLKEIRRHYSIEKAKERRTPGERSKLLELMKSLYT